MPPWPIVVDVMAPDIDPVRDILLLEDMLEGQRIGQHLIFPGALSHGDDNVTLPILIEIPWIVQV